MPYSITTKDGITIADIPDDMPADHASLRERVNAIRGQQAPAAPALPTAPSAAKGGILGGLVMGLRDPIDAGAQMLARGVDAAVGGVNSMTGLNLPRPDVQNVDNIVKTADMERQQSREMAAPRDKSSLLAPTEEPGFDWARLAGNVANPVNMIGGGWTSAAARTLPQIAGRGAIAGAVSGAMQPVEDPGDNFWMQKGGQAALGGAAGGVMTPVVSKAVGAVANGAAKVGSTAVDVVRKATTPAADRIDVVVNKVLSGQGGSMADIPAPILASVRTQVEQALTTGRGVDPAAILRQAQAEAVGLTGDAALTLGQRTRDPMQFANERNLSGVRIKTAQGEGNPLSDRFSTQNERLGENFRDAASATDGVTAGQTIMSGLKKADEPVRQGVDDAYAAARAMNGGRAWDLDRAHFGQEVNAKLDEGMWGAFVPPNVRTLLNQITEGKTPFNVDASVQIDTLLSRAQRQAERGGDDAGSAAIGVIRSSLHDAPLVGAPARAGAAPVAAAAQDAANVVDNGITDVPFREVGQMKALPRPPGNALANDFEFPMPPPATPGSSLVTQAAEATGPNEGEAARAAFDQARKLARDRFKGIEANPAQAAALDDAAPDRFVQKFLIGAPVRDVQALKAALAKDPESLGQARAQIAETLRRAAFGNNLAGDKTFAPERYAEVLRSLGPQKLGVFFEPAELVRLNLAGKVAANINSVPAGAQVNHSGTASALMNLLGKVSESPLLRKVPGARMVANQIGEIKTEQAMNKALSGQAPKQAAQVSPEVERALRLLLPPAAIATGSATGAAVQ